MLAWQLRRKRLMAAPRCHDAGCVPILISDFVFLEGDITDLRTPLGCIDILQGR
jgi:hypothetical protein